MTNNQNYIKLRICLKTRLVSPTSVSVALGFSIAFLVCFPLFHSGRLFLLDWVLGTNQPLLSTGFYGLNGGLTATILPSLILSFLNFTLGGASTWLPLAAFFPLATFSIGKLVGGGYWRRVAAGTVFTINPFVFNRIFVGHIPLLLGYALLPFAICTLLNSAVAEKHQWLKVVLWWFLLTSLSSHFAWIFGLPIGVVFLYETMVFRQRMRRTIGWFLTLISLYLASISYIILPSFFTSLPTNVGVTSLNLYGTTPDPVLGLIPNVLGMYGFWRIGPGPTLPKNHVPGWFLIFLAMAVVASFAFNRSQPAGASDLGVKTSRVWSRWRLRAREYLQSHEQLIVIGLIGIAGILLSLGTQGPTGSLFSWFYSHLSFFQLMREPQKFLMLWVLCLSVFFAFGCERILLSIKSKGIQSLVALVLCLSIPVAYTPTMFAGLGNQIALSSVPTAYQQANQLMGHGQGLILYLPWHTYMAYPFTNNRVVADIASGVFTRGVISGDNVESGGVYTQSTSSRSAYLQGLYAKAATSTNFGKLVEPLGVQYILLTKSADWTSYEWLNKQSDLKLVTDNSSLRIWMNTAFNSANASGTTRGIHSASHRIFEESPISYKISGGKPGTVTTDIPYQQGWMFEGAQASESPQGLVQVNVGVHGGILRFAPWNAVRAGYLMSGFVVLALISGVFLGKRNRNSKIDKAT